MKSSGILLVVLIFISIGVLLSLYFSWYAFAIAFVVLAYLMNLQTKPFLIGFISGAILWLTSALWISQNYPSSLPQKMSSVLPLGGNVLLIYVLTMVVGGLVGGFWTLAGSKLRRK